MKCEGVRCPMWIDAIGLFPVQFLLTIRMKMPFGQERSFATLKITYSAFIPYELDVVVLVDGDVLYF